MSNMKELMNIYNKQHMEFSKKKNIYKKNKGSLHFNDLINLSNDDKLKLLFKYCGQDFLNNELLKLEFYNFYPNNKQKLKLTEVFTLTQKIINKYQWKAGGFFIDDLEWILENKDDNYVLKNTIDNLDSRDNDTINFMKNICRIINGHVSNYKLNFDIQEDTVNKISRLLFYVEK